MNNGHKPAGVDPLVIADWTQALNDIAGASHELKTILRAVDEQKATTNDVMRFRKSVIDRLKKAIVLLR